MDFARRYCREELRYGADDFAAYSPPRQAEIDRYPGSWQFIPSSDPFTVATSCEVKGLRREGARLFAEMTYRRVATCAGQSRVEAVGPHMEAVSLELVQRDGAWRVLDPPPPHVSLQAAVRYFAVQPSQMEPRWFQKATPAQLAYRRQMVEAMEVLLQIRCREVAAQTPAEASAREALEWLLEGRMHGEPGREALGLGCAGGEPARKGWPPGRSALVATGYRIKSFEAEEARARAAVEYDVVAEVGAEKASPLGRRDEVAVEMVRQDGRWRPGQQMALYVSMSTAVEAQAAELARLTPEWFKKASEAQLAWWKRKREVVKTLFLIEVELAKAQSSAR